MKTFLIFLLLIGSLPLVANDATSITQSQFDKFYVYLLQQRDYIAEEVEAQTGEYITIKVGVPTVDKFIPLIATSINQKYTTRLSLNGDEIIKSSEYYGDHRKYFGDNSYEYQMITTIRVIADDILQQKKDHNDKLAQTIYGHTFNKKSSLSDKTVGISSTITKEEKSATVWVQLPTLNEDRYSIVRWLRTTVHAGYSQAEQPEAQLGIKANIVSFSMGGGASSRGATIANYDIGAIDSNLVLTFAEGQDSPSIAGDFLFTILEQSALQTIEINQIITFFWSVLLSVDCRLIINETEVAGYSEVPFEVSAGIMINEMVTLDLGFSFFSSNKIENNSNEKGSFYFGPQAEMIVMFSDQISASLAGKYLFSSDGSTSKGSINLSVHYKP